MTRSCLFKPHLFTVTRRVLSHIAHSFLFAAFPWNRGTQYFRIVCLIVFIVFAVVIVVVVCLALFCTLIISSYLGLISPSFSRNFIIRYKCLVVVFSLANFLKKSFPEIALSLLPQLVG